ncbi:MAG: hypothetical protein KDF65_05335, partial [Anaerolineae bacterium]|nr:hypothetical protein [Anaerolineae bacterium]
LPSKIYLRGLMARLFCPIQGNLKKFQNSDFFDDCASDCAINTKYLCASGFIITQTLAIVTLFVLVIEAGLAVLHLQKSDWPLCQNVL